jgi:hypothetical protein
MIKLIVSLRMVSTNTDRQYVVIQLGDGDASQIIKSGSPRMSCIPLVLSSTEFTIRQRFAQPPKWLMIQLSLLVEWCAASSKKSNGIHPNHFQLVTKF